MIPENPSRSARKREDDARQSLAVRLVSLSDPELVRLQLENELAEAIRFAASRPKHGSRRREILHVGALLRLENIEEIEQRLAEAVSNKRGSTKPESSDGSIPEETLVVGSPQVLRWKDALLNEDDAILEEILSSCPTVDLSRLRQLARNMRKKPGPRTEGRLMTYLDELEAESL